MIPSQRHLFDLADDIAYLNCAYTSPLLRAAARAGNGAIRTKSSPWTIPPKTFFDNVETLRDLFARLIGASPDAIAVIPAVSYGVALAAKNLPLAKEQSIVVLKDQFPSHIYSWRRLAAENGGVIKTVPRPEDGNWTPALLEAVDESTAIAALPNCHWTDGTFVDLEKVGAHCRKTGAALVVDATQSLGAMPFSVKAVRPDFLITTSHKWLLGPYSLGFCYVDPKWHDGTPLEENWLNRSESQNFARLVNYRDDYQPGARRFDVGEVSNFILSPIAAAALRQILDWGVETIAETLRRGTDEIAERAEKIGFSTAPKASRSPHMIGVYAPSGMPGDLAARLAEANVFVSVRGDAIRISPHLYNTDADVDRLFSVLENCV